MDPGHRLALLVLGMHRSGTSALTRVLNLLGVELGSDLLPAHRDNETGFWEHRGVVLLHDELLGALGTSWSDPTPLPEGALTGPVAAPFRERLKEILERDFAGAATFGLKDPRLCRLLPLWLPLLDELGVAPRCVLMGRHPDEVAASLARRDSLPDAAARLLWMNHVLESERESRGHVRAFVTYERLMTDWRGAIRHLAGALSLDWESEIGSAGDAVDAFLRGDLRHHTAAEANPEGGSWIERTWEAFRAGANGETERAGAAMDRVSREVDVAGRLFFPVTRTLETLRAQLDRRSRQYLALRRDVEELQQSIGAPEGGEVVEAAADIRRDAQAASRPRAGVAALARPGTTIVRTYGEAEGDPRVSIVIPIFNQVELTTTCLESLAEHTADGTFEVILVDNGSSDGTPDLLRCLEGNVKIVRNDENLGFATACNQGAALASTDLVLFLNNDIEAKSEWLPPLLALLDGDPSVGVVGSKLLFPGGEIQHAGVALLARPHGAFPLGAFHVHYGESGDCPQAAEAMRFQVVTGACQLVRRALFEDVGGFDTYFWNGCEDVDFCLKVGALGWKVVYEPRSVLVHHESKSGPQRFSRTKANEDLLASRWLGKVEPDLVEQADGSRALAAGTLIAPYARPGAPASAAGASTAPDALTSIVILTRNGRSDTTLCLESIDRHTPEPHEVIVVDNGSTDGTVEFLRDRVSKRTNFRLVENATNRGFAAGNNLGLAIAHGHRVVLLNNDTVVTDGWLAGLGRVLDHHADCGLVGPMTNYASGPQVVADVPYRSLAEMDAFALSWACDHSGSRPTTRLVGFCWMMRREVVEEIGGLDERFGTGNFEDDDYCLRAHQAGWTTRIAEGVFIHHAGSRTFRAEKIDYAKLMHENYGIFRDKWDLPPDARADQPYPFGELVARARQPKVTLPQIAATHELHARGLRHVDRGAMVAGASAAQPTGRDADPVTGALDRSTYRLAVGLLPGAEPIDDVRKLFARYGFPDEPPVWESTAAVAEQLRTRPLVLMLGPDVMVPDDALREMVSVMKTEGEVAAVGPMSNAAPEPQRGKPGYASLGRDLRRFASRQRRRRGGRITDVPHLGGFCLLLRSEAVRAAGGLDEALSIPDALLDLFGRLRERGARVVAASGAWVHHAHLSHEEGAAYEVLTVASVDQQT